MRSCGEIEAMAVANEFGVADEFVVPLRLNEDEEMMDG